MLRVKLLRLTRAVSQWELAKSAGMSQGRYSMIERGQIQPTMEEWTRLAEALGVTPAGLFRPVSLGLKKSDRIAGVRGGNELNGADGFQGE